jgi:hypothetical protein
MEGGKSVVYQAELFLLGKLLGGLTAITLFSLIFSLILSQLHFNPALFMIIFFSAGIVHLLIQGMVKKRWL